MRHPDIPKLPFLLFRRVCHEDFFEELQGDLEENFIRDMELHGKKKAKKIYWSEILKMMRPSVIKRTSLIPKQLGLLTRNYVLTSLRAIKHNPGYIFSNIFGLAMALSISTIGYFNFRFNQTFNKHYQQAENLYKVHGLRTGEPTLGASSIALGPALNASGITTMRYHHETTAVKVGNELFQESTAFADPEFLEWFELKSLSGQKITLRSSDELFISDKLALKLFGEAYPVGKMVHIVFPNEKERSFIVKDVFERPPRNVSFHYPMITSFKNYLEFYEVDEREWSDYIDGTFVHTSQSGHTQLTTQLNSLVDLHNLHNSDRQISSFRLDNILYWPKIEDGLAGNSFVYQLHPASVVGTVSTALAILLLACFNFINTSIALSGKRMKEIAVRKVMGGTRQSTITQFMIENSLMVAMAVILSFGISYFLIPAYNSLLYQEIVQLDQVPFTTILLFALLLVTGVAFLSGGYPAFYISRFSSLEIFRKKVMITGKNRLMLVLLTFQFALCFYNFASLYSMVDNSYYQESLDQGYALKKVINIPLYEPSQYAALENRLLQHPEVEAVSGTQNTIGFRFKDATASIAEEDYDVAALEVGTNYLQTLDIRLTKGSFFSENDQASANHMIVNSMLEDQLGQDVLNKVITYEGERYTVIGVVADFNLKPIMFDNRIKPAIIKTTSPELYNYASVKVSGSTQTLNDEIESIWYEIFPQKLYMGFLQERVLRSIRETNTIMIHINLFSSIITILISALGLYTLISLIVQRRSKEFGIRKVLGASKSVIVNLLGKDVYWILGIATVVGLGASYYVVSLIFDIIYAYHIRIGFWHLLIPSLGLFIIVIFTIGFKVMQTSRLNPVEQLRNE